MADIVIILGKFFFPICRSLRKGWTYSILLTPMGHTNDKLPDCLFEQPVTVVGIRTMKMECGEENSLNSVF